MIIGITGNSGSGKSKISKIIAKKINAGIIDADAVVRELSEPGNVYYKKIIELFGEGILIKNKLDKKQMAEIIYKNLEKREKLNKLTYKYVVEEIENKIKKINKKNIIIDAPLLFESNLNKICDFTVAIFADYEVKVKRICTRDNLSEEIAKDRLNIQAKDEFYIKNADYIIKNNGKIDEINWEDICTIIGKN